MVYKEEVRDLFSVSDEYSLAHCISADFGMGKGIVVEFNKRFDMKKQTAGKIPGLFKPVCTAPGWRRLHPGRPCAKPNHERAGIP